MVQSNFMTIPLHKKNALKPKGKEIKQKLSFQECIKPAPIAIKPFSSLINPFRQGCSIFCNHPTKNLELKIAIEKSKRKRIDDEKDAEIMGQILEGIICKYGTRSMDTETVITTPESEVMPPPRAQLVLNLRTTPSQETGRTSGGFQSVFSPSPSSVSGQNIKLEPILPPSDIQSEFHSEWPTESRSEAEDEEKPEIVKRRGKIRKKKKKMNVEVEKGEKEVVDLTEPNDTMVSTCKMDAPDYESDDLDISRNRASNKCALYQPTPPMMESDLFDNTTLRHLRRCLSIVDIEAEFRRIWKRVLQEALDASKVLPSNEVNIDNDIKIPPCEPEKWLCYPRTYKHSDSRFDLPVNKKILCEMKPLHYLKEYVSSSKSNLPLYNHIFNKYKKEEEIIILGKIIIDALGEVMGQPFDDEETIKFKEIVDLKDEDQICFRTWLGLCAFSERFYGEKFCAGKATDCGERDLIEILDFECLNKRMPKLNINPTMVKLLKAIECS